MTPLLAAYLGFYEDELLHAADKEAEARALIKSHTPKQRLAVYLEWNGIHGYTESIWGIASGEVFQ